MKNFKKTLPIIIIIIIVIIFIFNKKDENYIKDSDYLYDIAINYLIENDDNKEKDKENYKMFIDYKGFGISEDKKYRYAYMWILSKSYYIEDNKICNSSCSSMPYKFTFEKDNVVKYEIPKDGSYYVPSIKEMFPDDIENEVLSYEIDDDNLDKQAMKYYLILDGNDNCNCNKD